MSRMNSEDGKIYYPFFQQGLRFQSLQWTPADAEALDSDAPPLLIMSPGGNINLKMPSSDPAVNPQIQGTVFLMINASASTITLQTSAGAGFTTAIVLAANECTLVMCTGSATAAVGWRALGTTSSA